MAKIQNPRKQFNFGIQIFGMNEFLCQEVDLPDFEIDVIPHGDTNYDVKTGGRAKVGTLNVKKIMSATAPDNFLWAWLTQVQNIQVGGGALPSLYKRNITVKEYSNDGVTILNIWQYFGVWPSKLNGLKLSRVGSENTIEDIEFQVDEPLKF